MPYKDVEKRKEYIRLWIRKRREDYFADKLCKKCNSKINLELHHRNPLLKETHRIWSWSKERRIKELKKCDVLCQKCHKQHHKEKHSYEHGTRSMYVHCKCRCNLCKKANSGYHQKLYKNSKFLRDEEIRFQKR